MQLPLVKTVQGELKGVVCSGVENYVAFKGIPYAKPPLGELRFKVSSKMKTYLHTVTFFLHFKRKHTIACTLVFT